MNINSTSPQENNYLQILESIAKPPKRLYYTGKLPANRLPTVAIVGTRKPSSYGREVTERLAFDLAKQGIVIVSGLALGVDAIAHRAAIDANGLTIAVLANALPDIRPAANRDIGERILRANGAIISEKDEDYQVGKWSFLERNRIVAGISDAVLITEAAARSGSLNTAMYALEQGKEVFVVPGNITSTLSVGCNALLKQGATPVTCAEDILQIIAPGLQTTQHRLALGSNETETIIIQQLQAGLRDGDEIQRVTGIDPTDMSIALTMLEIAGTIKPLGANQWTLR